MIIDISDTKNIWEIQEKFNDFFPFLKLEFYQHPHHWYEEAGEKKALLPHEKIGSIRKTHPHGNLEIHSWNRTGDVEQAFRKRFNLNVQVFRQYRDNWVETVATDKLTLGEQNEIGKNAAWDNKPA